MTGDANPPADAHAKLAVLDNEAIAELRAFNLRFGQRLAAAPPIESVPVEKSRALGRAGSGTIPPPVFLPQARERLIPARAGKLRLRVLAPEREARGIYLHLHGGGWVLGDCDLQDPLLWELAQATGLCVASLGYRLAPEHPYPAAPDDCEDAAIWLLEHGAKELDAPPVFAIGGESAGANLSVVTLLRLGDRHGITGAFRAANLVYGCYDVSMTPSQRLWGERRLPLSTAAIRWFHDQYVPEHTDEQRRAAGISPLYADLHGLPPALFSVGALDPMLDDSLFMSARWRAAGNDAQLVVYPEAAHQFIRFPVTAARICNDAQHSDLRERYAGTVGAVRS
jgi:acetyl esterase